MKTNIKNNKGSILNHIWSICLIAVFILVSTGTVSANNSDPKSSQEEVSEQAKVTGLNYICVHVLDLEKSLKLYQEILGFKMSDAEVLHGPMLEGMLVLKLKANDLVISLSVTAPEFRDQIGPVGNTNHNHFMLKVNNIGPIGDKLVAEGYELENNNYKQDKYTFFTGPNGEIIGLSAWN